LIDFKLLVIVSVAFISYLHFSGVQYLADIDASNSWDKATVQTYGHQVDDFGVLGDDGLLFKWETPGALGKACSTYSKCNFIRLASMVPCVRGYRIEVKIHDQFDKKLSQTTLEPIIVPVGSVHDLEIDYRSVPKEGYVLLTWAGCSAEYPRL
jgi:hypothetical protein